jgi:hypothetical protein
MLAWPIVAGGTENVETMKVFASKIKRNKKIINHYISSIKYSSSII